MRLISLALLLFLTSCTESHDSNEFRKKVYERWSGAKTIHSIHPYIKQGESIKRPRGTWQKLFAVSFYDTRFEIQYDCLYYRVPTSEMPGMLAVTFNTQSSSCSDGPPSKVDLSWEGIYNFSYEIALNIPTKYHLKLMVDEFKLLFDFMNFKLQQYNHELASNSVKKGRMTGVKVSSVVRPVGHKSTTKLTDGVLCHGVDKSCKTLQEFRCDQCENGWYEIISSDCPSQYNKICGQDDCGKRGRPACIRGRVATDYKLEYCINDSPIGFCDKGLRVFCNANQLVCR